MTGLLKVGSVYLIKKKAKSSLGISFLNIKSVIVVKQDRYSYPVVKVHEYKSNHHRVLYSWGYCQNNHLDAYKDAQEMVDMTDLSFSVTNNAIEKEIENYEINNFGSNYGSKSKSITTNEAILLYL